MNRFFRFFEQFARPFERPNPGRPPASGLGFIKHHASQVSGGFMSMLVLGGLIALLESSLFMFVGFLVDMMNEGDAATFFTDNARVLIAMAIVVGVLRSIIYAGSAVVEEQIIVPDFFTLVRWQSHQNVAQQDVSFFDDQLAGRISSKVWQTGHAAGDFMVSLFQIIWFIAVFAATSLIVIASLDWRIMLLVLVWLCAVGVMARLFVPRIRDEGRMLAEVTAVLTGRMVDGYSNIRTIKLHSAEHGNDEFIKQAFEETLTQLRKFTRIIASMRICNQAFSSMMLVAIAGLALLFFQSGVLTAGQVAVVLALCLRLNLLLGRLLGLLNGLFRNFGTVQNSAALVAMQPTVLDPPNAGHMKPARGDISFDNISFSYNQSNEVVENLTLSIPSGQKVGIVGPSGVGKTTLISLLLRFHDLDRGAITIDGTDIASVAQSSLRAQMSIVTQDTALMHRSIKDNIAYGKPDASDVEIENAAKKAKAHDFIINLEDTKGRKSYETLVGERGVKLSGGQRQRIALARVFLRNSPILLLDEATSALDSEVEAAIQENLGDLMEGKTVIAIAHRLSTISHLDRLIVMDENGIVEDGTHEELLQADQLYASLWKRQSGGFLTVD